MSCASHTSLPLRRIAMLSVHSCPLAPLGGRETGGMNVYVRDLSRLLGQQGIAVDVYTRRQDPWEPTVVTFGPQARVIHLHAGPAAPYAKHRVWDHLPEFVDGVLAFATSQDVPMICCTATTGSRAGWPCNCGRYARCRRCICPIR